MSQKKMSPNPVKFTEVHGRDAAILDVICE